MLTGIRLSPDDARYLSATLHNTLTQIDSSGRSAQVSGMVGTPNDAAPAGLTWFDRKQLREFAARAAREAAGAGEQRERSRRRPTAPPPPAGEPDPYAALGVPRTASQETIQAAYRARMNEYHPDKVAHLGEELQQLAHRKALEIQRAYEQLRR